MKAIFLTFCLIFSTLPIIAESTTSFNVVQNSANPNAKYILYPTTNLWAFLKLDTTTGIITQVHYTISSDGFIGEVSLNPKSLLKKGEAPTIGRFALYPTQNMFNFILLDTKKGQTWQVQWSNDSENRGILEIPQYTK